MSVHFANMQKLSMDEFITLLPTHFDADILKTLGLFRYNRKGNPESVNKAEEAEIIKQDTLSVVPGHPSREVVCYTHALAAASGATGSDSSYSIDTTR
jgi:hypothetical protein